MIKIPIERIRREEGAPVQFVGTGDELGLEAVKVPVKHLEISCHLAEAEEGFFLTCESIGELELACHRCLTKFEYHLDTESSALIVFEKRAEFEDEEGIIEADPHAPEIDITKLISDSILLDIPYKVLCTEDCQGLCPQCGTNLNESTCDCTTETIDPRWAKLQELNFDKEGE